MYCLFSRIISKKKQCQRINEYFLDLENTFFFQNCVRYVPFIIFLFELEFFSVKSQREIFRRSQFDKTGELYLSYKQIKTV